MLDIKYRFTCGESGLRGIIQKCQNIMARIVSKICFTLSTLPMMIQLSGKGTSFGWEKLVRSENN